MNCTCGIPMHKGRCLHCDFPPPLLPRGGYGCPPGCGRCRTRDSRCPICKARCGTPAAAEFHEQRCRAAETRTESKRREGP